ncbi:MAG TPA: DNA repair protein RecN, partial [Terriglobales bacterium]|nr:DNA repair protein RecN [Terriglobales bacterium]
MLRTLYVRDYALIDEMEVAFDSGLNVITGETGAGKSILLGALSMILGERASMEVVRGGAKKAIVEGTFDEADTPSLRALLEASEIEPQGTTLIMRREITPTASRAFINDTPATLSVMREVASRLIDLHGQHEHQSLLRTETHLDLLDSFGSLGGLVSAYRRAYDETAALVKERKGLVARERELRQQKELYGFQIEEIDRVNPQPGEEEELEAERRVLENAERLFDATQQLYEALYEGENAVNDQLVVVRNELQDLCRIDKDFEDPLSEVRTTLISVSEVAKFLQDYNARIEFNPERLERIRDRMSELELLKRKYGLTVDAVLDYRQEIGASFSLAADFEGAIARLADQIRAAQKKLTSAALRLSAKRHEVAERVQKGIVAELKHLGMPHAQFEVHFGHTPDAHGWIRLGEAGREERVAAHATGMDTAEFYISTNVGEAPRPLARVASGGEVSRVMLALKTILAKAERMPILVFDEID